MNLKKKKK